MYLTLSQEKKAPKRKK